MSDGAGDFRMMNRLMVNSILEIREYNRYMKGLFSYVGFETKWIPFNNVERAAGSTKWNFKSLFSYALEGIFSFSTAPLKLSGIFGVFLFVGSIILSFYTAISTLISNLHKKWERLYKILVKPETDKSVFYLTSDKTS